MGEFLEILRGNPEKPALAGWERLRSLAIGNPIGNPIYESMLTGEVIPVDEIATGK